MTLSAITGATVEQVETTLVDLEAHYRSDLEGIHRGMLGEKAKLRKLYQQRRKLLEKYRDALVAEGPGGK